MDAKTKAKLRIEELTDPLKMDEKELKPCSDFISELVSSDQPMLSTRLSQRTNCKNNPFVIRSNKDYFGDPHRWQFFNGGSTLRDTTITVSSSTTTLRKGQNQTADDLHRLYHWYHRKVIESS